MNKIVLLTLVLLFVGVSSCHKSTQSDFVLNETIYTAGESLDLKVRKKKRNQIWAIEDANNEIIARYDTNAPDIRLAFTMPDGMYSLNVYDNELEYAANVYKSEQFIVKSERATLKVQKASSSYDDFEVWLDFEKIGEGNNQIVEDIPLGLYHMRIISEGELIEGKTINLDVPGDTYSFSF